MIAMGETIKARHKQISSSQVSTQALPGLKCSSSDQDQPLHSPDSQQVQKRKNERMDLAYTVDSLNDIISSTGTLDSELIVTDEQGIVLYLLNSPQESDLAIDLGCDLTLEASGVNALGLALGNRISVKVSGADHNLPSFKDCISLGIPILQGNTLLGCAGYILTAKSLTAVQIGILDNVIRASLQAAAKMLEARKSLDELHLLKEFFNNLDNKQGNMIVDVYLNIIQINRQAEILLGLPKEDLLNNSLDKIIDNLSPDLFGDEVSDYQRKLFFNTPSGKISIVAHIRPVCSEGDRLVGWHISFDQAPTEPRKGSRITPKKYEFKDIIGQNKEFMKLLGLANAVAKSPSNVLITGESGTGKELFAQAIHNASFCADGPFVAINCAAIPKELIETELFGYVEGAFTGARKKGMPGKFVLAHEGSLFLDEIGDMPLELQAKLLRVLQERSVMPVGGSELIPVNIRVISATNQKLEKLIDKDKFRADLFYRLNVINLHLPSLRYRKDDIPFLVRYFLQMFNYKLNKNISQISKEAIEYLMAYDWPGNIRQLENVIETAVNLAEDAIELEQLSFLAGSRTRPVAGITASDNQGVNTLEEVEKMEIIRALKKCDGNVTQAAIVLNIGRATLYRKIKKYNILSHVSGNSWKEER